MKISLALAWPSWLFELYTSALPFRIDVLDSRACRRARRGILRFMVVFADECGMPRAWGAARGSVALALGVAESHRRLYEREKEIPLPIRIDYQFDGGAWVEIERFDSWKKGGSR